MGSAAVCRAESSACRNSGKAGAMAVVERCRPLRLREARPNVGNGALEKALGRGPVVLLSRAGRVGYGVGYPATLYSYGSAIGESRVRDRVGNVDVSPARSAKKRTPEPSRPRSAPAQPHLSCLIPQMGFVPSVPVFPQKESTVNGICKNSSGIWSSAEDALPWDPSHKRIAENATPPLLPALPSAPVPASPNRSRS